MPLGAIAVGQSGDNFVTWSVPANDQLLVANIADGDLFIFALTRPEPEPVVGHAVNAGDAAFAFLIPQPNVTLTMASGAVAHAVSAGDVSFDFVLPQPAVTHTPRVTVNHTVNAGDAGFSFAIPQPAVTHTTVAPTDHAVNAGDAAFGFFLPQPTVTHSLPTGLPLWSQYAITINTSPIARFWTGTGRLDYQGDLFEGGGRAVGVGEVELVSGNPDRRLTITLSSIPPSVRAQFLQDVGAVEVEVALIFSTDRGATWRIRAAQLQRAAIEPHDGQR